MVVTTEQLITAVSAVGCVVSISVALITTRRAGRQEIRKDAATLEGLRRDLGHVLDGLADIKREQERQRDQNQELCERVARLESRAPARERGEGP